ncbi:hypothetical protein DUI87_16049 [Hirundo rustica rustica]|uniref:Uncharacterized protein n=1 Tax=Hirundo rustica rustica TaxID=333673 RepID=A0A3M0K2J8_HIRRU|nr:hypothetical protein DUI87_16049 [Hirundo rustica rustica]
MIEVRREEKEEKRREEKRREEKRREEKRERERREEKRREEKRREEKRREEREEKRREMRGLEGRRAERIKKKLTKIIVKYFLNMGGEVNFTSVKLSVLPLSRSRVQHTKSRSRASTCHGLHKHSLDSQALEAVGLLE